MDPAVFQAAVAPATAPVAAPTFSILTPLYKTAPWAGQAIASVLAQTRADWELLLVDNACPDDSAAAARPYLADPRISLARRAENRGVAVARNELLARARGDYVVQLDSDDWLEPEYLESVARVFNVDPGAGIAAPNAARYIEATGRFSESTTFELCGAPRSDDHDRTLERLLRINYVPPPFTVRRDALLAAGGWSVEHEGIEDLALLCDLLRAGWRMHTIWRPVCVYRVRTHSTAFDETGSERMEIRHLRERFLASVLAEGGLSPPARRQARRSLVRSRVRTAIMAGDVTAARRALWRALRRHPSPALAAVALVHTVAPGATARFLRAR